jgi:hypothetical protein
MFSIIMRRSIISFSLLLLLFAILLAACTESISSIDAPGLDDFVSDPTFSSKLELLATTSPYPPPVDWLDEPIKRSLPEGGLLNTGPVIIDGAEVVPLEDSPSGYGLRLMGTLPTPCHNLVYNESPPDEQEQIFIEVFSVTKPGENCIQIIEVFDVTFPLDVYIAGEHTVWVNGEQAVETQ